MSDVGPSRDSPSKDSDSYGREFVKYIVTCSGTVHDLSLRGDMMALWLVAVACSGVVGAVGTSPPGQDVKGIPTYRVSPEVQAPDGPNHLTLNGVGVRFVPLVICPPHCHHTVEVTPCYVVSCAFLRPHRQRHLSMRNDTVRACRDGVANPLSVCPLNVMSKRVPSTAPLTRVAPYIHQRPALHLCLMPDAVAADHRLLGCRRRRSPSMVTLWWGGHHLLARRPSHLKSRLRSKGASSHKRMLVEG